MRSPVSVRPTAHRPFTMAGRAAPPLARSGVDRPGCGREFVESVGWMAREPLEECAQVGVGLERVAFGAGDEAVELAGSNTRPASLPAKSASVLAAESNATECPLRRGIVGYEFAVAEVALEGCPPSAGVADRRGQRPPPGQDPWLEFLDPKLESVENLSRGLPGDELSAARSFVPFRWPRVPPQRADE